MNQSANHRASCDRTTAHAVRPSHPVSLERTKDDKHHQQRMYLFQRHDAHQLPNTGDISVTEAQQGEESVCLRGEREREDHTIRLV